MNNEDIVYILFVKDEAVGVYERFEGASEVMAEVSEEWQKCMRIESSRYYK